MQNIMEIVGGAGGGGIATELAQITRRTGIATGIAQIAHVASGRIVSAARGTGRQEIATGFSEF
jgi:hypothetical protein